MRFDRLKLAINSEILGEIPIPPHSITITPDDVNTLDDRGRPGDPLAALPRAGGIVHVKPGVYEYGLNVENHHVVAIVGENDAAGGKPLFTRNLFNMDDAGQVVYCAGVEGDGEKIPRIINGRHRPQRSAIKSLFKQGKESWPALLMLEDCHIHNYASNSVWPSSLSVLEIYDSELNESGGGLEHNIYVGDEVYCVWAENSYFHSARAGHPFKSSARKNAFIKCRLETTARWREYIDNGFSGDYSTDPYFGLTPLDLISCSEVVFHESEINMLYRNKSTGGYACELKAKKTAVNAISDPPYQVDGNRLTYHPHPDQVRPGQVDLAARGWPEPIRAGTFWDRAWWRNARANQDRYNLRKYFTDSTIRLLGPPGGPQLTGIYNQGTYPKVDAGGTTNWHYPIHEDFYDRSLVLTRNVRWEGLENGNQKFQNWDNQAIPLTPDSLKNDYLVNPRAWEHTGAGDWTGLADIRDWSTIAEWRFRQQTEECIRIMWERIQRYGG